MRALFLLLAWSFLTARSACAFGQGYKIGSFGVYPSPDQRYSVEVKRREKSLVDFSVVDVKAGKSIANGSIGSDAMRWFLYWDASGRLWAYGSDLGYFKVFDFREEKVLAREVTPEMVVPKPIWDSLPYRLKRVQKVE